MAANIDISTGVGMIIAILYQVLYVVLLIGALILIVYLIRLVHLLIKKLKHDTEKKYK
jgi:hypothetical protein